MFRKKFFFCIITITVILLLPAIKSSYASERKIYIITSSDGVLVSENDCRTWNSCSKGLPENCRPVRFYTSKNDIYLATYASGIFRFEKGKWADLNSRDFRKRSIYNKIPVMRKISAFAIDPDDESNLALATKHTVYRSTDRGTTWQKLPMNGLNRRCYITALAVSGNRIFAGTSFNGVFEFTGREFREAGNGLPFESYSNTMKFTEQISYLHIDRKKLYAGFQFGGGLFVKSLESKNFVPVLNSGGSFNSIIYDIKTKDDKIAFSDGASIRIKSDASINEASGYNDIIKKISSRGDVFTAAIIDSSNTDSSISLWIDNPPEKTANITAAERKAIYISVPALHRNLKKYIEIANSTEIDTFVIDMKDDFGNIYFPSENTVAAEINAIRKPVDLKSIIAKLKSNGIYSVARIVTFKDEKLYNAYNGKYAIKNKSTGEPWRGVEGEFWVDAYSEFVHNYNIDIAKELEKSGFNEIQFDYIRFPSDGPVHLCKFSFQNDPETYKSEILIDFLQKAKQFIKIPVSVDIYGFNSWYYFGNMIGQDMEELSYTVDVICPMVYPSHFGSIFYNKYKHTERPYQIVKDGGIRALKMINRKALLRPYIQGFNLMSPTWGPVYITDQIKGSRESGCSGYSIWNAKGEYDVPYKALKEKK